MDAPLDINPQTKVGKLLEVYPQLEEVLLSLSPSFAKLKNPVLRKTVARVATLRQIAEVGGLDVRKMVIVLRQAVGADTDLEGEGSLGEPSTMPDWVDSSTVVTTLDASDIIARGESPMTDILERAKSLERKDIMLLITPFLPSPVIDLLRSKGCRVWSDSGQGNRVYTYISKQS